MKGKNIGIYGGTFDPIHLGHISLAQQMLEIHHLDEVWFCPARVSPHKQKEGVTDPALRCKMVEAAIEPFRYFRLIDIEVKKAGPSYTVDTLRELKDAYPQHQFYLILGHDAVAHFDYWKEPEVIVQIATLLVGMRACNDSLDLPIGCSDHIKNVIKQGLTPIAVMEISSTDIRMRLAQGRCIAHLVPQSVAACINKHHIY